MADHATVDQVWNDPDFQGLPSDEKRKVLTTIDPDFKGLSSDQQDQVLGIHAVGSSMGPTGLQKVSEALTKGVNFINDPTGNVAKMQADPRYNSGIGSDLGLDTVQNKGNVLFDKMGTALAETMGEKGFPTTGAALGTAVSMANPLNWIAPKGGSSLIIRKPLSLPADEAASGVQFTRPEITGNPNALSAQRVVQETPTGGAVINPFKAEQASQIEAFKKAVIDKHGSTSPDILTGHTISDSHLATEAANHSLSDKLYDSVPTDAKVAVPGLAKLYNEIVDELPKPIRKLVKKYAQIEPIPVTPPNAGEYIGITDETTTPASTKFSPTDQYGELKPVTSTEKITKNYKVGYSAEPDATPPLQKTPTIQNLKDLRSRLGAIANKGGTDGFNAGLLKRAISKDIENAGSGGSTADAMLGNDAADKLNAATKNYSRLMDLEDNPVYKAVHNAKPEDLADIPFKAGKVSDLQVARIAMGEPGFQVAQQKFFTELANSKDIGKTVSSYDPDFIRQALNPDQIKALTTLDAIKSRAASAGNVAPMTGSSRMNMWLALAHGVVTHPLKTILTGGVLPYGLAQGMTQAGGTTLNLGSLPGVAAGASNMATRKTPIQILRDHIQRQQQNGPR